METLADSKITSDTLEWLMTMEDKDKRRIKIDGVTTSGSFKHRNLTVTLHYRNDNGAGVIHLYHPLTEPTRIPPLDRSVAFNQKLFELVEGWRKTLRNEPGELLVFVNKEGQTFLDYLREIRDN